MLKCCNQMRFVSIQCSTPPDPLAGFKGEGKGGKGRFDSDAQLEQGRRLAKAGPDGLLNFSGIFNLVGCLSRSFQFTYSFIFYSDSGDGLCRCV